MGIKQTLKSACFYKETPSARFELGLTVDVGVAFLFLNYGSSCLGGLDKVS